MEQIPPPEKSVFSEIEDLLAQNKIPAAIEGLRELRGARQESVRFSQRWHRIQDRKRKQELSSEDVIVEQNKLTSAILEVLEQIEAGTQEASPASKAAALTHPPVKELQNSNPHHQVFICYAGEDLEFAQQLYQDLEQQGVSPWMAYEDILPGQNWEHEIQQSLKRSSYVLVLLSSHSISKHGYVRKEIKQALDTLDEFPPDQIYLIPVRLDDSQPLDDRLHKIHWVDLWPSSSYRKGLQRILRVLALKNTTQPEEQKPEAAAQQEALKPKPIPQKPTPRKPEQQGTRQQSKTGRRKKDGTSVIHLRSEPRSLSRADVDQAVEKYRGIKNEFEDAGDVILDRATGLMWQKFGSIGLNYEGAQKHVEGLNHQQFAGYDDWRLPTIPELVSLLESKKQSNGLYIDPIFYENQWWCWSIDGRIKGKGSAEAAWGVYFSTATLLALPPQRLQLRSLCSSLTIENLIL